MFTLLATERTLQVRGVIAFVMFAVFGAFWSALVLPLAAAPLSLSHTAIGAFGLLGAFGAFAARRTGALADRGLGERASAVALGLMLLAWVPLWFTTSSLWALAVGVVVLDVGVQALMVVNQVMIFQSKPQAQSRLVSCYMLYYAAGSGLGAFASTAAYGEWGWPGVCVFGAALSLVALGFWAATLPRLRGVRRRTIC